MLHIKIKENHECSNVVANILPADPPPPPTYTSTYTPTLWMGSVGKKSFFCTWSVTYPIKENHKCCNILSADTLDPMDGVNRSKFNFLEHGHVAYQFKGNH